MDCMFQLNVMRYTDRRLPYKGSCVLCSWCGKKYTGTFDCESGLFVSSINESRSIESYTWSNYYSLQSFSFYTTNIILDSYTFWVVCTRCCHHQNKIKINWEFPARNTYHELITSVSIRRLTKTLLSLPRFAYANSWCVTHNVGHHLRGISILTSLYTIILANHSFGLSFP